MIHGAGKMSIWSFHNLVPFYLIRVAFLCWVITRSFRLSSGLCHLISGFGRDPTLLYDRERSNCFLFEMVRFRLSNRNIFSLIVKLKVYFSLRRRWSAGLLTGWEKSKAPYRISILRHLFLRNLFLNSSLVRGVAQLLLIHLLNSLDVDIRVGITHLIRVLEFY